MKELIECRAMVFGDFNFHMRVLSYLHVLTSLITIMCMSQYLKFECVWVLEESYQDMLQTTWNTNSSLNKNLEELKIQATNWNMHTI